MMQVFLKKEHVTKDHFYSICVEAFVAVLDGL